MVDKGAALVTLKPSSEIVFHGPFTDVVTAHLRIENPQSRAVCFKVKTTAPKQYCVKPNSGVVRPGEYAVVAVMLQPVDGIPTDAAKHKFMVQSTYAPSDDTDLDSFWKTVNPAELTYGKLKVVFEQKSELESYIDKGDMSSPVFSSAAARGDGDTSTVSPIRTFDSDKSASKLEAELARMTRDNQDLLRRIATYQTQSHANDGIPVMQVALLCLAALLIGLITGRLF